MTELRWQQPCGESTHCVEVAYVDDTQIVVRSTKDPSTHLVLDHEEWMQLRFYPWKVSANEYCQSEKTLDGMEALAVQD